MREARIPKRELKDLFDELSVPPSLDRIPKRELKVVSEREVGVFLDENPEKGVESSISITFSPSPLTRIPKRELKDEPPVTDCPQLVLLNPEKGVESSR